MLGLQEEVDRAELCGRFGVSRKTGYKWLRRFQEEGLRGLVDRPRRPEHSPHRTDPALEAEGEASGLGRAEAPAAAA